MAKFRNPYNYDQSVVSFATGIDLSDAEDKAQQNQADETDINRLVAVYARTGQVPGSDFPAFEFDAGAPIDYHTAMNQLIETQHAFGALPSEVRDRFANDPGQLLQFLNNPDNRAEALQLGLIHEEPRQERLSDFFEPVNSNKDNPPAPPSES